MRHWVRREVAQPIRPVLLGCLVSLNTPPMSGSKKQFLQSIDIALIGWYVLPH